MTQYVLEPMGDRVLVEAIETDRSFADGQLLLPETNKDLPMYGVVVGVGPGLFEDGKYIPMNLEVGDRIFFGKFSAAQVTLDKKSLLVIKESEVLAVVRTIDERDMEPA